MSFIHNRIVEIADEIQELHKQIKDASPSVSMALQAQTKELEIERKKLRGLYNRR